MKRVLIIIVIILFELCFVGCSNNIENNFTEFGKNQNIGNQQQEANVSNLNPGENMKGKTIDYNISYNDNGSFGYKEINGLMTLSTLVMVTSLDELIKLCTEYNNTDFLYENNSTYNEDFFKDNILIIYSFETDHSINTSIKNVVINNETLLINLDKSKKEGFFTAEAFYWTINIVVKKQDTEEIKQVKINY